MEGCTEKHLVKEVLFSCRDKEDSLLLYVDIILFQKHLVYRTPFEQLMDASVISEATYTLVPEADVIKQLTLSILNEVLETV